VVGVEERVVSIYNSIAADVEATGRICTGTPVTCDGSRKMMRTVGRHDRFSKK
jgi:hypothetical protein